MIEIGAQHDVRETSRVALGHRFQQVRRDSETLARAAFAGGPTGPVDAGRQPHQVAPGARHLVLRDLPAVAACPATGCSTPSSATCSTPTTRRWAATPAAGARADHPPRAERVRAYRAHVDAAMERLLAGAPPGSAELAVLVELGPPHEEQHQELILMDVLHLFASRRSSRRTAPATSRKAAGAAGLGRAERRLRGDRRDVARFRVRQREARATDAGCGPTGWPAVWSPTANGSPSSRTAATRGPSSGSRTAGRGSARKAGRRRSTGSAATTAGGCSAWAA